MSVAGEISEHRLGARERALGVDEPLAPSERAQEAFKGCAISELGMVAEEGEFAGLMSGNELLQHQAPEQLGECTHRQEEALAAGDPFVSVS